MRIIGSSCRRRGISTILGVIIFVGIMFTAVIPMFLVMNQADTLHELRKHELRIIDEERVGENMLFYTIPITGPPPELSFTVENRGENLITIERIWLNNIDHVVSQSVPSMTTLSGIGPYQVSTDEESYFIKLITDRGNIFIPSSGVPTYYPVGGWEMDSFTIFIMMTELKSQLHILVNNTENDVEVIIDPPVTYFDSDVANNQPGYMISLPLPGEYYVNVTRWHGTPSQENIYPISGDGLHDLGLTTPTVLIII